jgi:hypothetical protein
MISRIEEAGIPLLSRRAIPLVGTRRIRTPPSKMHDAYVAKNSYAQAVSMPSS